MNRSSTNWDFTITESISCPNCCNFPKEFTYHVGNSFSDISVTNIFYPFIENIFHHGISSGCSTTNYCPLQKLTREQIAKFLYLLLHRKQPTSCNPLICDAIFEDIGKENIFCPYAEKLFKMQITSGCEEIPLYFCPSSYVTRQELAKLLCLTMESIKPGSCQLQPCSQIFDDVPDSNPYCSYIEALYNINATSGCFTDPQLFCPNSLATREQMAFFSNFALQLSD
ncbi:MAG: hypothetical protein A2Y62_02565 [Candidatus Fischerbacteria bacterium RBG_13_37_8]|uniref:SLH domain-containing protein n=1 Tax=Candidatus Fischerbacteria bacterium RBG_13_37_8 TaxID=1817863 RepID=A0A1F5V5F1_9BACT|nr:MAG: hypothetical protein A2Y62_02565 [Candidatus Fischerbacteria bacterium RBG_13_37_8]